MADCKWKESTSTYNIYNSFLHCSEGYNTDVNNLPDALSSILKPTEILNIPSMRLCGD